jgi:hypothetical protein
MLVAGYSLKLHSDVVVSYACWVCLNSQSPLQLINGSLLYVPCYASANVLHGCVLSLFFVYADASEHRSWFAWGTSAISTFLTPASSSSSTVPLQKPGTCGGAPGVLGEASAAAPPAVAPGEEDLQELLELLQAGQEQVILQQPEQVTSAGAAAAAGGGGDVVKGALLVSCELQVSLRSWAVGLGGLQVISRFLLPLCLPYVKQPADSVPGYRDGSQSVCKCAPIVPTDMGLLQ